MSYLRDRAAGLLTTALGYDVDPDEISPALGGCRSEDVYRWEVFTYNERDMPRIFGCWQTLTEFVRLGIKYGITVDHKDREVDANEPPEARKKT